MNMKKSMIALAVAGAFVSSAAMADATIYGVMHGSIDRVNNGAVTSSTTNQATSRQSRLGFKGSDDLGGGMSAIWQVEGYVGLDAAGTVGTLTNRNIFLGLKSDSMGTVLVGRNETPYKMATRKLDVFADTAADNRVGPDNTATDTDGMGAGHDIRVSNIFSYTSPDMSGLSIAAATVFGAEGATSTSTKGSALSLAAMYNMDQIYATVAYQTLKAGSTGTGELGAAGGAGAIFSGGAVNDKSNATKLGGGYTTDQFAVNAVYENLTYKTALTGTDTKSTNIYIAGKFNVSSTDAAKLAWTKVGDSKTAGVTATDGAKQLSVGYDHSMSKNTTVYALYTKTTTTDAPAPAAATADPSVISLGMKVAF